MLLANPYFWLGELGLLLSIVGSAVLLHRFQHESIGLKGPIFFLLLMSLFMLVKPALYTMQHTIPPAPYLYRLAEGLFVASQAWYWRTKSTLLEARAIDRIARWSTIALVAVLAYIGYRIKNQGR